MERSRGTRDIHLWETVSAASRLGRLRVPRWRASSSRLKRYGVSIDSARAYPPPKEGRLQGLTLCRRRRKITRDPPAPRAMIEAV
jgi:hypothetical protein